jgi:hypothetical protein
VYVRAHSCVCMCVCVCARAHECSVMWLRVCGACVRSWILQMAAGGIKMSNEVIAAAGTEKPLNPREIAARELSVSTRGQLAAFPVECHFTSQLTLLLDSPESGADISAGPSRAEAPSGAYEALKWGLGSYAAIERSVGVKIRKGSRGETHERSLAFFCCRRIRRRRAKKRYSRQYKCSRN